MPNSDFKTLHSEWKTRIELEVGKLSVQKRVVFAIACAERLADLTRECIEMARIPKAHVPRETLDEFWRIVANERFEVLPADHVEHLKNEFLTSLPIPEGFNSILGGYQPYFITCIIYTLSTLETGGGKEAASVGLNIFEMLSAFIYGRDYFGLRDKVSISNPEVRWRAFDDPLSENEREAQLKLVAKLLVMPERIGEEDLLTIKNDVLSKACKFSELLVTEPRAPFVSARFDLDPYLAEFVAQRVLKMNRKGRSAFALYMCERMAEIYRKYCRASGGSAGTFNSILNDLWARIDEDFPVAEETKLQIRQLMASIAELSLVSELARQAQYCLEALAAAAEVIGADGSEPLLRISKISYDCVRARILRETLVDLNESGAWRKIFRHPLNELEDARQHFLLSLFALKGLGSAESYRPMAAGHTLEF